ncbi:MAG: hypothetical protein LBU09_01355 [Endomicrobium sp.]|jgi:hypothetical protein|nr:hypothetical protein [Endomicrobium sp.]
MKKKPEVGLNVQEVIKKQRTLFITMQVELMLKAYNSLFGRKGGIKRR